MREDGTVSDVTILSGHSVLARSVKANLLRWTFKHADNENIPGDGLTVTYSFQFKGSCDNHKGCKEEFWYEPPDKITTVSELPRINTVNLTKK